ncbi:MAG: hypothetical protein HPY57_15035 [Ignavibacteria bacterium]|nr:hypothetical protein [Ignavibacteria bacterium]
MKVRNGFVSNSSSSSFIIDQNRWNNISELAEYMIKRVEYKPQVNEVLQRLKECKDLDQPVMFYSCNYDTWINKYGEHYFVTTCNNEDWGDVYSDLNEDNAIDIYPELEDVNCPGSINWNKVQENVNFFDLERNLFYQRTNVWQECKTPVNNHNKFCGYTEYVKIHGEIMCPNCFHLENGKPSKYLMYKDRYKKLKRINKDAIHHDFSI